MPRPVSPRHSLLTLRDLMGVLRQWRTYYPKIAATHWGSLCLVAALQQAGPQPAAALVRRFLVGELCAATSRDPGQPSPVRQMLTDGYSGRVLQAILAPGHLKVAAGAAARAHVCPAQGPLFLSFNARLLACLHARMFASCLLDVAQRALWSRGG